MLVYAVEYMLGRVVLYYMLCNAMRVLTVLAHSIVSTVPSSILLLLPSSRCMLVHTVEYNDRETAVVLHTLLHAVTLHCSA
jgi:EamA domain-containing membrane protein RarD